MTDQKMETLKQIIYRIIVTPSTGDLNQIAEDAMKRKCSMNMGGTLTTK